MTKKELESKIGYLEKTLDQYTQILDFVRTKMKHDPDMEFALRKQMARFVKLKNRPEYMSRDWKEMFGIPFDADD